MKARTQFIYEDKAKRKRVNVSVIKHILVPYDGSTYSKHALTFAMDFAAKYDAKITVLTVMYSNIAGSSFLEVSTHQREIDQQRLQKLNKQFDEFSAIAKKHHIELNSDIVIANSVIDSILSYVHSYKADLIMMGTRGRGGSERFMIGSVSLAISQKASCPVMLVK